MRLRETVQAASRNASLIVDGLIRLSAPGAPSTDVQQLWIELSVPERTHARMR